MWFVGLWAALACLSITALIKRKIGRRLPTLFLHFSFLVILAGASTTFFFGKKGYIHLSVGQVATHYMEQESRELMALPFTLQLDSFRIKYYPGTEAPADYVSYIHGERPISMNDILVKEGYRFYQSSFDDDKQGSWLSVNYDPWGIATTYTGYLMLGLSMIGMLFSRKGEFRRLLHHLRKGGLCILFFTACSHTLQAADSRQIPALSQRQADSIARTQVIYHDRVVPFNTLARDFVLKLTGKPSYKGLTAEQVVGGWLLCPDEWEKEPMIYIKNKQFRQMLGLTTPYACFTDLFDGERYKLQDLYIQAEPISKEASSLEKAFVELDEKVGLILMLQNGYLIQSLPTDGTVSPLSSTQVNAELLYNRIPFSKLLFMFCLTMGFLAFFHALYTTLYPTNHSGSQCTATRLTTFFTGMLVLALVFHALGYGLRWYISGRIPLSNGYETMQFMALCALSVACLLRRRFPFIIAFGFLLAGFTLLVSYLGQMNPQITPLMPVLVSPWLSSHVSLIMMSYALFAFLMLNGILGLCLPRHAEHLMLLSRLMLYPATFFLGAGIFLGAVWANVSWGRYWAWDPKEVWALITFLVYGLSFHSGSLPSFRRPRFFHLYMILAFLTVLMTYFGVNYLLGGMHSYGNG